MTKSIAKLTATIVGALPELTDEEWAERDAKIQVERDQVERRRLEEEIASSKAGLCVAGCRRDAVDATFAANFDITTEAMRHVRAFEPPGIWCLAGGVGCGKTVAATWWLAQHAGSFPVCMTAEQFEARSRYDRAFRETWEMATVIVLDDLGAEYGDGKHHFLVGLDALIDHVAGEKLGMVITTNTSGVEFRERYGARIISRIRQRGGFFTCGDDDRRRK